METIIPTNEYQTPITREFLDQYPDEVQESFLGFIDTVPLLKWMIGERPRAKDLPRDNRSRIIVDITHPHILEDMDYFRPAVKFYQENGCYSFLKPNSNPNSEYGKWFNEEVRRCREGYVRESDGEWVTGLMYWFLNYCPIMVSERSEKTGIVHRVEGFPVMWEGIYYRFHYIDQARRLGKHCVELARRGAHPYEEKVFTPSGWRTWGDVSVGDKLFGTNGETTTVLDIPFDSEAPCYKVTLKDGRSVVASDDHLWVIWEGHKKHSDIVNTETLLHIYRKKREVSVRLPSGYEHNCFISKNLGVNLPDKEIPIDPYTIGFILGDGCLRHDCCYITVHQDDIDSAKKNIPYRIVKWSGKYAYKIAIPDYLPTIGKLGLRGAKSKDKFIPDCYKYNSKDVRLAVLQGLFDTDACVHGGVPELTTVSEKLRDDVVEVARSLGYTAYYTVKRSGYKKDSVYIRCQDSYRISVYAGEEIFRLSRKKQKVHYLNNRQSSRRDRTSIANIEYVGIQKCKCVTVDALDSCYLIGDFVTTHNCGKSYGLAAVMSHNLLLGEDEEAKRRVTTVLTAYTKEYLAQKDGTFSKFTPIIDFSAANTEFPRLMLTRRASDMLWVMGYKNSNGNENGSLNSVMGLSVKDDEGKIRGKRGFILFEEMGNYPNFKDVWDNVRDSVKNGDDVFSLLYAVGTAGDDESDFSSIRTILYKPDAYEVYALENVYDKRGKGASKFAYFFPSYISREGCMDKDGNSDVVLALMRILMERYMVKQGGDSASLLKRIAQMPITPEEAILRVRSAFFPTVMLNERIRQLDSLPHIYDDIYVGELVDIGGKVEFRATRDIPIREYPVDNLERGALEIYAMPSPGKTNNRYCIGVDPVDNDKAESQSLMSVIVFDLYNDEIVAEYTGRQPLAEDGYEIVRLLAVFYNATVMYESNRKMMYAYFSKKRCLWMLSDCPEWIKAKGLVKYSMYGSSIKGVSVNAALISTGIDLINDWLKKTYPVEMKDERGETHIEQVPQLYKIRNRALLQELVSYAPEKNTDRVSAMFQVMFLREQFMILYGGSPGETQKRNDNPADDPFFSKDWERYKLHFGQNYKPTYDL